MILQAFPKEEVLSHMNAHDLPFVQDNYQFELFGTLNYLQNGT